MSNSEQRECTGVEIKVPWGHISGKWWGPQTTRPILALHGWQDNAGSFDTLIPLLPPHIGILAIDLPGHGFSSRIPDGQMYYNLDYVTTVCMIMKEYNWDKVSILAHSMGSIVGFLLAGIFPDKVELLIGLDAYKPLSVMEDYYSVKMNHIITLFLIADDRNRNESEPPSYPYDECIEKLYIGAGSSIDRDKCAHILERNIKRSTKYPDKYYFTRDSRIKYTNIGIWPKDLYSSVLEKITCPTLFIRALDSPVIPNAPPFDEHLSVLKKNPRFEYEEVDGRHHVHLNEPHKVSGIISKFLLKHTTPSSKL